LKALQEKTNSCGSKRQITSVIAFHERRKMPPGILDCGATKGNATNTVMPVKTGTQNLFIFLDSVSHSAPHTLGFACTE
jgi:hypothetical protein